MLAMLNDALQERRLESQYVTMLFAVWNDENQTLQVANSGAVQPIFCRAGQSSPIRAEGFPLGMFPNVTYDEFSIATEPGDVIVFVSDGILDAENAEGEMYGEERLTALLCGQRPSLRRANRRCHPRRRHPLSGRPRPFRRRNDHRAQSAVSQGLRIRDSSLGKNASVPHPRAFFLARGWET